MKKTETITVRKRSYSGKGRPKKTDYLEVKKNTIVDRNSVKGNWDN